MTGPVYAIGDLHGHVDQLENALSLIARDGGPEAEIVFLGDYVDRGPDSRGVLDRLIAGRDAGKRWITLLGNHDRMFSWFLDDIPRHDPHLLVGYHWLHARLGGAETLRSYDVVFDQQARLEEVHAVAREAVPTTHRIFLQGLEAMHQTPEIAFVHAGIRPGLPLSAQRESDLVWIRNRFHSHLGPHPKLIVHGHTPVDRATHYGNRVNLDSGAGYGRPVAVAVFEGRDCWVLTQKGRVALKP